MVRQWPWSQACQSPRSIWTTFSGTGWDCGVSCTGPDVGFNDPCGSPPTQAILWLNDKYYSWKIQLSKASERIQISFENFALQKGLGFNPRLFFLCYLDDVLGPWVVEAVAYRIYIFFNRWGKLNQCNRPNTDLLKVWPQELLWASLD